MNHHIKFSLFLLALLSIASLSKAQSYNHSFKFNYGVFYYNDEDAMGIKDPLSKPFSLGLQYQSNLSKALSNSIGFTAYSWKKDGTNYESYAFQDLIFLRNNVKLLNRLKPQIGIGFGVESSTLRSFEEIENNMFFFVPVNVGIQTDLSEHLALGIFGEFKYGFDTDFTHGRVVPNNTAGISLAYRFGRNRKKTVYNPIKWDANEAELISLKNLKDYQDFAADKKKEKAPVLSKAEPQKVEPVDNLKLVYSKVVPQKDSTAEPRIIKMTMLTQDSVVTKKDSVIALNKFVRNDSTGFFYLKDSLSMDSIAMQDTAHINLIKSRRGNLATADSILKAHKATDSLLYVAAAIDTADLNASKLQQSLAVESVPFETKIVRDTVYLYADSISQPYQNRIAKQTTPAVLINNPNYLQDSQMIQPNDSLGNYQQTYGTQSYQSGSYQSDVSPQPSYYQQADPVQPRYYPQTTAYQAQQYPLSSYQASPYQATNTQPAPQSLQPYVNLGYTDANRQTQLRDVTGVANLGLQVAQLMEQQKQNQILLSGQMEMNRLLLNQLFPNNQNNGAPASRIDSLNAKIADLQQQLSSPEKVEKAKTAQPAAQKAPSTPVLCVITYGLNKVNIDDAQRNLILNNVVREYNKHTGATILIEAHTDSSGSPAYNKKISDLRLKNISDYLTTLGIPAARIVKNSYGEVNSSKSINNEERRVVFKIKY